MADVTTSVLRIEHAVPDYEAWKREGFDRDPIGRGRNGVRRYRVLRSNDNRNLVAIALTQTSDFLWSGAKAEFEKLADTA